MRKPTLVFETDYTIHVVSFHQAKGHQVNDISMQF